MTLFATTGSTASVEVVPYVLLDGERRTSGSSSLQGRIQRRTIRAMLTT